jgi:hypothetical protein
MRYIKEPHLRLNIRIKEIRRDFILKWMTSFDFIMSFREEQSRGFTKDSQSCRPDPKLMCKLPRQL